MSTFIEFQTMILNKLCSIEDRISNIESALGISEKIFPGETSEQETAESVVESPESTLEDELSDFQKQLNDIKSLFD